MKTGEISWQIIISRLCYSKIALALRMHLNKNKDQCQQGPVDGKPNETDLATASMRNFTPKNDNVVQLCVGREDAETASQICFPPSIHHIPSVMDSPQLLKSICSEALGTTHLFPLFLSFSVYFWHFQNCTNWETYFWYQQPLFHSVPSYCIIHSTELEDWLQSLLLIWKCSLYAFTAVLVSHSWSR